MYVLDCSIHVVYTLRCSVHKCTLHTLYCSAIVYTFSSQAESVYDCKDMKKNNNNRRGSFVCLSFIPFSEIKPFSSIACEFGVCQYYCDISQSKSVLLMLQAIRK